VKAFLTALCLLGCAGGVRAEMSGRLVALEGELLLNGKAAEPGALIKQGDRLQSKSGSSALWEAENGMGLALGPETELRLAEGKAELQKGSVLAFGGLGLASEHLQALGNGILGLDVQEGVSELSTLEAAAEASDPQGKRRVSVEPFSRLDAAAGRMAAPLRLPKRELGDFQKRWERSRAFHGQRAELLKAWDKSPDDEEESKDKKELRERRKEARRRFERAKEEIKKERKKNP
jgi:hypothetical protein